LRSALLPASSQSIGIVTHDSVSLETPYNSRK
jgi:hypothetical protein